MLNIRVAFNLLRKDLLSLLSFFSSIKLVLLADDLGEYILVFGFVILASEYLYSRESSG